MAGLTDRVIAFRIIRGEMDMDRLTEILTRAAGVVGRATAKLEDLADLLRAKRRSISAPSGYLRLTTPSWIRVTRGWIRRILDRFGRTPRF